MKKKIALGLSALLAGTIVLPVAACGGNKATARDPEKDPLVLSIQPVEMLFNPFFSTAGTDSSVVGMTQTSMLSADREGEIAFGDEEPCVVKDYSVHFEDASGNPTDVGSDDGFSVYQFVIKKGLKFSDGVDLTIKDVLFNLYMYLDPVYTGSSTIYSTDIVGLEAYRSLGLSTGDDNKESPIDSTASTRASQRWANLSDYMTTSENASTLTDAEVAQAVEDTKALAELFKQEVNNDWASAGESLENYQKEYNVSEQWEVYLLLEGVMSIKIENGKPKKTGGKYDIDEQTIPTSDELPSHDQAAMTAFAFEYYQGNVAADGSGRGTLTKFAEVMNWASGSTLRSNITAEEKSKIIQENIEKGDYPKTVEGIEIVKGDGFNASAESKNQSVYDASYDVLQIRINGIDPKAIWNFGFTVSPMHYYSDASLSNEFNETVDYHAFNAPGTEGYDESQPVSFGFPMGNYRYMTQVVQARNHVPMGAGIYKATNYAGASDFDTLNGTMTGNFYDGSMVYYERNPYFYTTFSESSTEELNAKIKYMRYKVVDTSNVLNALVTGELDYADVGATPDNQNEVNLHSDYLKQLMATTNGYGYIGINAKYVQNIYLRRAIMSVLDASLVTSYYPGTLSSVLTRPMTTCSWVYNYDDNGMKGEWNPEAVYSFSIKEYDNAATRDASLEQYNYWMNRAMDENLLRINENSGTYEYLTDTGWKALKFTFTIAGGSDDHPAYQTLAAAMRVLNDNGWQISINPNSRALTELSTGSLAIWCAAWSSTIDPDMFQVYHMESKATNTLAWGYDWIKANASNLAQIDYDLLCDLSDKIDEGRSVNGQGDRSKIYHEALNILMDLAVEFPLYQRRDLFVYNDTVIDPSTLDQSPTSYSSPISEIWKVNYLK